jgi:hypothetical protein
MDQTCMAVPVSKHISTWLVPTMPHWHPGLDSTGVEHLNRSDIPCKTQAHQLNISVTLAATACRTIFVKQLPTAKQSKSNLASKMVMIPRDFDLKTVVGHSTSASTHAPASTSTSQASSKSGGLSSGMWAGELGDAIRKH